MALIHAFMIGAISGMRAMTPLAAVTGAARLGRLPVRGGALRWLGDKRVVAATAALAAVELGGDKMQGVPDRISVAGLLPRIASGALAGAALVPSRQRNLGAALGAVAAAGSTWLSYRLRSRAMRRHNQVSTGAVEDAIAAAGAALVIRSAARRP